MKIKSKTNKNIVFLVKEKNYCQHLDMEDEGYPPYCKLDDYCRHHYRYGTLKYCGVILTSRLKKHEHIISGSEDGI